jgi:glycosyltransferase involved in cell wall biosynthesis
MKVVILGNYSRNLVVFRGAVIRELVDRGHEVIAVGPENDAWTAQGLCALGATFVVIPMARASLNPFGDVVYMMRVSRLLSLHRPQAVITFTHKPNTIGALASVCLGHHPAIVQLVEGLGYSFIDVDGFRKHLANSITRLLYRVSFRFSSYVLFLNESDRQIFESAGLFPPQLSVEVLDGIGIDLERFSPTPVPFRPFTFLIVARLLRTKGLAEFCLAAKRVKVRYPEVCFVVVGAPDPSRDGFSLLDLQQYQDEGTVRWIEQTNDIERLYRECSVYVLPSYREGAPVTVMEAMASGRPVITTDVPGCRTTVTHGYDGIIVPPKDPEALAGAMLDLLSSPARVRELGAAARITAERRFDSRRQSRHQVAAVEAAVHRRMMATKR